MTQNVKYSSFVKPGNLMKISLKARSIDERESSFIGTAHVDDRQMVTARLKLRHFNLAEQDKTLVAVDERIIDQMKCRAKLLGAC